MSSPHFTRGQPFFKGGSSVIVPLIRVSSGSEESLSNSLKWVGGVRRIGGELTKGPSRGRGTMPSLTDTRPRARVYVVLLPTLEIQVGCVVPPT